MNNVRKGSRAFFNLNYPQINEVGIFDRMVVRLYWLNENVKWKIDNLFFNFAAASVQHSSHVVPGPLSGTACLYRLFLRATPTRQYTGVAWASQMFKDLNTSGICVCVFMASEFGVRRLVRIWINGVPSLPCENVVLTSGFVPRMESSSCEFEVMSYTNILLARQNVRHDLDNYAEILYECQPRLTQISGFCSTSL